jgi:hypothetical protein
VVKNMHFADDVLKTKFLGVYVPYQERMFHVDHEIRDLTNQYVQADQQTLSDAEAVKFLARGLKLQNERNEIFHNYIEKLKRAVPASGASRLGSRKYASRGSLCTVPAKRPTRNPIDLRCNGRDRHAANNRFGPHRFPGRYFYDYKAIAVDLRPGNRSTGYSRLRKPKAGHEQRDAGAKPDLEQDRSSG